MRAEITAEEMLLNQKGKQPEGVLKLPGLQRTPRLVEGMASACEKHHGYKILYGHCNTSIITAWPSLQHQ